MGKYCDRTGVPGCIRVAMDQFMELGTGRHGVQQQDKTGQQPSEHRLAVPLFMSEFGMQTICF